MGTKKKIKPKASGWATFFAVVLFAAISPALSVNAASDPLLQCLYDGYRDFVDTQGQPFASTLQCAEYLSSGGTLKPSPRRHRLGDYNITVSLTNKTGVPLDITTAPVYDNWNCASGGAGVSVHLLPDAKLEETVTINQSGICHFEHSEMFWNVDLKYENPIFGVQTFKGRLTTSEIGLGLGFDNDCFFPPTALICFTCKSHADTNADLKVIAPQHCFDPN